MSLVLRRPNDGIGGVSYGGNQYTFDSDGLVVVGDVNSILHLVKKFGCVPVDVKSVKGVDGMSADVEIINVKQKVNEGDEQLEAALQKFNQGYRLLLVKDAIAVLWR